MCVAGLNVSTQPCEHRWYQLVRPCEPTTNLSNCPQRLKLEGWEIRNDTCPFCNPSDSDQDIHQTTHRLFGSVPSSASSVTGPADATGTGLRRGSSGSDGTANSLSRNSSVGSTSAGVLPEARAQRRREMNERLNLYLTSSPHEVLPSARKNYPTYSSASSAAEEVGAEAGSLRGGKALGKRWKKGVRMGKSVFKA